MITTAKESGHLRGLVPHLVDGGLTHLQYADDTLFFLDFSEQSIVTMKFLLYCYEAMSGLKINYEKSELFVVGVEDEERIRVANLFNCKVGSFPTKYLGVPTAVGFGV
jgi:hypothetical protein